MLVCGHWLKFLSHGFLPARLIPLKHVATVYCRDGVGILHRSTSPLPLAQAVVQLREFFLADHARGSGLATPSA